ncbi:hypothetical protein Y032_0008g103 [Ancylostoma ceylanicum]|uniref:Uncharacterized protein n=1 Tax=Ancylostoma ceylanicum TaxID=53326 RepID=A0A016VK47_9BILA|nr:hypothetical protein Y032_0008g103 [Ancylostoma ceylanicum]
MAPILLLFAFFSIAELKNKLANHGITLSQYIYVWHPDESLSIDIVLDVDCITLQTAVRKIVTEIVFVTSADVRCGRERYYVGKYNQ